MEEEPKKGAPAWMVSFGDMMTLILTFFILLVSMSEERQKGLIASGIGSFVVAIRSFGLPGVLSGGQEVEIHKNVRTRFNLPPEEDPERRDEHVFASSMELIRAKGLQSMKPHDELSQPAVATFDPDSAALTEAARDYLDLLASTLRPGTGQILLLEGHALDAAEAFQEDDRWLANARSIAVRKYLIDEHGFREDRVEARAWVAEISAEGVATRSVDARLLVPASND